jgi:hypothetical protein
VVDVWGFRNLEKMYGVCIGILRDNIMKGEGVFGMQNRHDVGIVVAEKRSAMVGGRRISEGLKASS